MLDGTYSIASFNPGAVSQAAGRIAASPPSPWVTRVGYPRGMTMLASVRPRGGSDLEMDNVVAPTLVADLLRPGWLDHARPLKEPIAQGGRVYRGFELVRPTTLGAAHESWVMHCLIAEDPSREFDWRRAVSFLDGFHRRATTIA